MNAKTIIKWIAVVLFSIAGIASLLKDGFWSFFFYSMAAIMCVPQESIPSALAPKANIPSKHKYIIVFVFMLLGGITSPFDTEKNKAVVEQTVKDTTTFSNVNPNFTEKSNKNKESFVTFDADGNKTGEYTKTISKDEMVKNQFSAWDGSHTKLVLALRKQMNDDDSFEHISTKYLFKNNLMYVMMDYRGKNAFGAKMRASVVAEIDPETGDVLNMYDPNN